MENTDLGKHCLLLNKPGFHRWRHMYAFCGLLLDKLSVPNIKINNLIPVYESAIAVYFR